MQGPARIGGLLLVIALALGVIWTALFYWVPVSTNPLEFFGNTLFFGPIFVGAGLLLTVYINGRRNFRRTLLVFACLATVIALAYAEEDWRGWHAWHHLKQRWMAKGEYFSLAELVPPPVPEADNFAMTPIAYSSYGDILTREGKHISWKNRDAHFVRRMNMPISHDYNDPKNGTGDLTQGRFTDLEAWQAYYREQSVKTNEFAVPAQPGTPAADVLLALGKYRPAIEELRAASQLPASRFPLNYDSEFPAMIYLPHLAALKSCALTLQLRSAAELQNGQSDQAAADVQLGLQLTGKIQTEPILISHLVRIAMTQLMLQTIWEGLARQQWSETQLVALAAELATLDFPADYQRSMRGEIALQSGNIDALRHHPEQMDQAGFRDGDSDQKQRNQRFLLLVRLIPAGWFYQNQYHCADTMLNHYLPVADVARKTFSPALARQGDEIVAAIAKSPGLYHQLELMMLPALGNAAKKFAYAQASVDMARTAIALERHRLALGGYPETLDALAPRFMAEVPHDVIGGQPLKYRREAGGRFTLYSIGWNEKDDGGVMVFTKGTTPRLDLGQGDWGWQYP